MIYSLSEFKAFNRYKQNITNTRQWTFPQTMLALLLCYNNTMSVLKLLNT